MNAALALATVRALQSQIPVSDQAVEAGLRHLHWPGRLQTIRMPSGQELLLDGAHNTGGIRSLCAALRDDFADRHPTLILGILGDKDWPEMCREIALSARRIVLVPVRSERTASPNELSRVCHQVNPAAEILACPSLEEALRHTAADPFVLVTGSLYLVGEALELVGGRGIATGESALNEYGERSR